MTQNINRTRRSLLAGGTMAALAAATGAAHAKEGAPAFDKIYDVIVVGSGFAGLAAALQARLKGAEVLLIEKMPVFGGNSAINGGAFAVAGSPLQEKEGIKDSADLLFADIMKAGGGPCHPAPARRIADESVANFKWLRDDIGVQFKAVTYHGGHSVKRSHAVTNNSGSGFILPMLAKLKEFGIEPRLRFIVDEIIVNDKKEVIGVKARQGYRFGRENSGKVLYVRATKGVLIAAGGFAQNVKYRMSQDPRLTDKFTSTNHPGATGEMIMQAQEIGANTVQMDWIQLGPWTSPDEKGFGVAPLFVESCVGLGPMVDPATGKRFIKETGNRKVRADAIVAIGHPCVIYTCEANVMNAIVGHNMTDKLWEHALKTGVVKKFDTLKDLAAGYGIDYATLEKTNETFNGYMKAMKDPEFDCMFFKGASVNDKGPFYGVRLWPRVHHCMGGLEINEHAQVMSVRGTPIKGLYAAGEATGGVHGMVRLGTVAVADCMIFGRIAARDAFKKA